MQRRHFLKSAAAIAALMAMREEVIAAPGEIPRRTLGRTGQSVSVIGLGGHHIGRAHVPEQEGIRIIRTRLDRRRQLPRQLLGLQRRRERGPDGRALQDGYRQKAFLMTKIDGRTQGVRRAADRRVPAAPPDRPHRPPADSRSHPPRRSRRVFAPGGADRGARGGAERRQDSLHRLHRPQEPGDSPAA